MNELLENLTSRLREAFDPGVIGALVGRWIVDLTLALVVLAAFWALWRLLRATMRFLFTRFDADPTTTAFVETVGKFAVFTIAALSALDVAGIATAPVLASIGLVGITVGFAARDVLSNIISGLLIYLDRPFTINDLVEIDGNYGRVDRITLRSTRVVTPDGKMLAVPNTQVINNTVTSYTNFPNLRLDITVNVGVREDLANVRRVLIGLVRDDPAYLAEPAPKVVVTRLNDYNVEVQLQAWLKDERAHIEKRLQLREQVFTALGEEGVEMPFETIQLAPFEARLAPPTHPGA